MNHAAWEFLNARISVPSRLLGEPGPDPQQVDALLQLAVRVPDHGRLTPWRFVRVSGSARAQLGQQLANLQRERNPQTEPAVLEKDRNRFNHAPLVIAVIARLTAGHKVPEQEQLLSAGLASYNLLLGAQAMGFGAQWLTGWAAYDTQVAPWFNLGTDERIIAFVHIGTPREPAAERVRPDAGALLTEFSPPAAP